MWLAVTLYGWERSQGVGDGPNNRPGVCLPRGFAVLVVRLRVPDQFFSLILTSVASCRSCVESLVVIRMTPLAARSP
jgi:hypothetical protein